LKKDWEAMLGLTFKNVELRSKVENQYEDFLNKEGAFSKETLWTKSSLKDISTARWWKKLLQEEGASELAAWLYQLHQLSVSSSSNGRVFSAWKWIMGDRRSRLSLDKQIKCVRWCLLS
jgi:hypothetical protein